MIKWRQPFQDFFRIFIYVFIKKVKRCIITTAVSCFRISATRFSIKCSDIYTNSVETDTVCPYTCLYTLGQQIDLKSPTNNHVSVLIYTPSTILYITAVATYCIQIWCIIALKVCHCRSHWLKRQACNLGYPSASFSEKDLQVPQSAEQPEPLGRGAEGDQITGGHGLDLTSAG